MKRREPKTGAATMAVTLTRREGVSDDYIRAESELRPEVRAAMAIRNASSRHFEAQDGPWEGVAVLRDMVAATRGGNMGLPSDMLTSQAATLDAIFTDCAHRSMLNMNEFPEAAERYMRMALKAQANSRATIEALVKLHQPREQTVRHVHVHEGGQAVVAENMTLTGGARNDGTAQLSHAPSPALLGTHSLGVPLPVTRDQRKETVPDARRQKSRSTEGE